ncbi:uncharacterized protein P884DRAFT_190925 [Thermothelomyces heterothallicus CBS 202.75]|uniref:uncharacterized protein n=1 Tax=Thermothelomyces heterothallicus CBS 202.75 TaxID=1149848 RepID=UPI003743422C
MSSDAISTPAGRAPRRLSRPNRRPRVFSRLPVTPWTVLLVVLVSFASYALAAVAPLETPAVGHGLLRRDGQGRAALPDKQSSQRGGVQRRAASEDSEPTTESSEPSKTSATQSVTTTFSIGVGSETPSSSGSRSGSSSSTTASASPLPSILDSLVYDFAPGPDGEASPCPTFIKSFLADPNFKKCYPLSMLFDSSRSFFEAQRSAVGITRTLDATCAANATFCTGYLNQLAQNLTQPENCGTDYERGQSTVADIYNAMMAYGPVYSAGCLRDPDTGAYCYANAVTNLTNPSSTYIYFLPLNKSLPGTTVPSCGYCLQRTMALYQAATADRRQMIANTYVSAAQQVNTICGPNFVNETLAAEVIPSGAAKVPAASLLMTSTLPLLLATLACLA